MSGAAGKIQILCSRLDLPGGIERAIVNTANLFAEKGHAVQVLVLDTTQRSFYSLHPSIQVQTVPLHFGITNTGNVFSRKWRFIKDIQLLRNLLLPGEEGVVICTEYVFSIAAYMAAGKKSDIWSWEHHHFHWLKKNLFWDFLFRRIYPRLEKIICLNPLEAELFLSIGAQAVVIPNFITGIDPHFKESDSCHLLTVGWLIHRKGIDRIPDIAKTLADKTGWTWKVIGEGEEKENFLKAINQKGMEDKVVLAPPTSQEVGVIYAGASVYVLTSRFECFPMVLLEAMSRGIPCIAFDCPSGPGYIISNEEDGILVRDGDVQAMSNAIMRLIDDPALRKKMGENAVRNVQRFSSDRIYQLWKEAFGEKR